MERSEKTIRKKSDLIPKAKKLGAANQGTQISKGRISPLVVGKTENKKDSIKKKEKRAFPSSKRVN